MTENERNKYFCEFIKEHFDIDPVPTPLNKLETLRYERAAVLVRSNHEAFVLGYHGEVEDEDEGYTFDPALYAPWCIEGIPERAFSYDLRDRISLKSRYDFEEWEHWIEEDEDDECMGKDIQSYGRVYYVVDNMDDPIGLEDLI